MKQKKIELDVDFIGGQDGLTPEEEKSLSEFFKQRKANVKKTNVPKKRPSVSRSKKTA